MKKLLISICFFIFCLNSLCANAYENFNGNYTYQEYRPNSQIKKYITGPDEEILFIMDFSGSMNKKMGYTPKAFLAIDAIRSILNDAGNETKIGLRIFGITDKSLYSYSESGVSYNKENICSASSLVMPIAKYNNENISDKLSQFAPQGGTPIGYSLRQAVQNDFSPNVRLKHIILVTDGNETCGDDPCLYITRLMQLRDDIKIDVIGVTVEKNEYSQLQCIAETSGGKFYTVDTPEDFHIKIRHAFSSSTPLNVVTPPIKVNNLLNKIPSEIKYKNFAYQFMN